MASGTIKSNIAAKMFKTVSFSVAYTIASNGNIEKSLNLSAPYGYTFLCLRTWDTGSWEVIFLINKGTTVGLKNLANTEKTANFTGTAIYIKNAAM